MIYVRTIFWSIVICMGNMWQIIYGFDSTLWNPHAHTYRFRLLSFHLISSHLSVCLFCLFSKHAFFDHFQSITTIIFSFELTVCCGWIEERKNAIFFIWQISARAKPLNDCKFLFVFFRCYFLYWTWTRKHDWLIALSGGVMCVCVLCMAY